MANRSPSIIGLAAMSALLLAACSPAPTTPPDTASSSSAATTTSSAKAPAPSGTSDTLKATVNISGFKYVASSITVKKGTTVTWKNRDGMAHTVTGDGNALASKRLETDDWYSFTFDKTGTYNYHCAVHPTMVGTVIVTE